MIFDKLELEARRLSEILELQESIPPRLVQKIESPVAVVLHRFNNKTRRAGIIYCSLGPNDVIDAAYYEYVDSRTSKLGGSWA